MLHEDQRNNRRLLSVKNCGLCGLSVIQSNNSRRRFLLMHYARGIVVFTDSETYWKFQVSLYDFYINAVFFYLRSRVITLLIFSSFLFSSTEPCEHNGKSCHS